MPFKGKVRRVGPRAEQKKKKTRRAQAFAEHEFRLQLLVELRMGEHFQRLPAVRRRGPQHPQIKSETQKQRPGLRTELFQTWELIEVSNDKKSCWRE